MKQASRRRIRSSDLQAVGTGLIALDVIFDKSETKVASAVGGSAGNVLAALAYLGWNSVPVCELGKDAAGKQVVEEFKSLNADLRFMVESENANTPVVYQMPADFPETHSFSFACPHCGERKGFAAPIDDSLSDSVLEKIPTPSVYYFDRITSVSLSLAEEYRAKGVLVVFEPSVTPTDPEQFQRAVSSSHILKYADNRFSSFPYDVSKVILQIKTKGSHGLDFRLPGKLGTWTNLPAIKIAKVADTAGAGDWCTAGMLATLFEAGTKSYLHMTYQSAFEALRYGQSLAALNCMYTGARGVTNRWGAKQVRHLATELLARPSSNPKLKSAQEKKNKRISAQQLCCELV